MNIFPILFIILGFIVMLNALFQGDYEDEFAIIAGIIFCFGLLLSIGKFCWDYIGI